jgi:hypothetical protein
MMIHVFDDMMVCGFWMFNGPLDEPLLQSTIFAMFFDAKMIHVL